MYFGMVKLKEKWLYVHYRLSTNIQDGLYINRHGKERGLLKTIYGYFRFNKLTENIEFDPKSTHLYFFDGSREARRAHIQLIGAKMYAKKYLGSYSFQSC